MGIATLLVILAFIAFALATPVKWNPFAGLSARVNLVPLGLALLTLAALVGNRPLP